MLNNQYCDLQKQIQLIYVLHDTKRNQKMRVKGVLPI